MDNAFVVSPVVPIALLVEADPGRVDHLEIGSVRVDVLDADVRDPHLTEAPDRRVAWRRPPGPTGVPGHVRGAPRPAPGPRSMR